MGGAVSLQSESGESEGLKGDGTKEDPYKISSAAELEEFRDEVNSGKTDAWAELTDDIDLSGICSEESDTSWTPIGNSIDNSYRGTFDGNGKTISGLYINSSSAGLFGYVSGSGKIEKLSVSGDINGNNYVGGVVGLNRGSVENCYNTGTVTGTDDYVGGVVGYNYSGTVENCYNTGSVSGRYVGGVVGYNDGGRVENCYNTGTVSGNSHVGGVVGYNYSGASVENCYNTGKVSDGSFVGGVVGDNSGSVENCYNTGSVTSSGGFVGGVVGYNYSGASVENCYNIGDVSGTSNYVGGVVGYNDMYASVTNCYNIGSVTGSSNFGGVVGYNSDSGANVTGCYFLQSTAEKGIGAGSATGAESLTAEAFKNQNSFTDWDFGTADTDTWTVHPVLGRPVLNENKEGGLGTKASPYQISTATQLKNFATAVNSENGNPAAHAVLMDNINLNPGITFDAEGNYSGGTPQKWTPIGNFSKAYTGTFDGNNYTISGLYIDSNVNNQGLFGYVGADGIVQNLTVTGSVSGSDRVGGVVGYNNGGTVTGCTFSGSGSVSGVLSVGGVVGNNDNSGSVENCYNTGTVSGSDRVGGVVGYNNGGTVENCYNTGEVTGRATVGGVVGYNSSSVVGDNRGNVTGCYNTGEVTGRRGVGGVVGYNDSSVENCYYQTGKGVAVGIGGPTDTSGKAEGKDEAAFHSGEVAYLLEQNVSGDEKPVWGQDLTDKNSLPTLVALNPDAAKEVYQLTFDWHYEGAPEGTTTTTNVYTNGSVAIPEINHDRAVYHISGWKDANGAPVTTETAVTADTTYIAEWTANTYTITVTAGSGGTVSGSGEYSEGTQVTVTATPATGYHFVKWTENGTQVSTSDTYSFTATANRTLTANFAADAVAPDPTPSGPSTGDSTGWADILDELENAENGDQITIDMGEETEVPAEIFATIAGKDVDVIFDLGDVQWSASGENIPTDAAFTDLDLGVALGTSGIPVNVINTITGEVGTVQITLAHNGDFGFTLTLTAPLGKENAGYWANLYHYDEEAEAMNFEAAAKIDETGSVTIPFSHASQYAIVIDEHSHATVVVSDIFTDVAPNAWYTAAIQYAYDNGLMTGVSDTEFAPEATTTRAMIVSILARLEGVESAEAAGFADVEGEWYATAVNWAANVGVVNGYEDNTFKPNTAITREQLAAILMNYASYKGEDVSNRADLTSYTDQPSAWAEEAMQWAVAEGLISGVTTDTLQPQGAATRAQVAAILQRFLEA